MTASIEAHRTLSETLDADPLAATVDQLARCYLARPDRQPSDLAAGLRILTGSPPELIDAAIAYCANKGWLDSPDDADRIEEIVRRHVK